MLPELVALTCSTCQGEGYVLYVGGPGQYSASLAAFEPEETVLRCSSCHGEGVVEACATCQSPIEIVEGREVCACSALELAQAA